jgi:hypothetical protein
MEAWRVERIKPINSPNLIEVREDYWRVGTYVIDVLYQGEGIRKPEAPVRMRDMLFERRGLYEWRTCFSQATAPARGP